MTCSGNSENINTRAAQIEQTRLWTVHMDDSKGATGGTLEDAIRTTLTNEIDLTCNKCKKLGKEGEMGRTWLRMRDVPEVLFIRIARFKRTKRGRLFRKCNNEVLVPEILDLAPFLEDSKTTDTKFRLSGTINHAGTMESGHFVSHVRGQNRHWYRLDDEVVTDSSIVTLNDDPARFGKKHKFTPYVLAYTRIFDNDLSPDPPLQQPSASSSAFQDNSSPSQSAQVRAHVKVAGQSFIMTHKLKGFEKFENQDLRMQMDIVKPEGESMLSTDTITVQLVKAAKREEGGDRTASRSTSSKCALKTPKPKKTSAKKGLLTPHSTPKTAASEHERGGT